MNLHGGGCRRMILFETPESSNMTVQIIGRLVRLNQRHPVIVKIYTVDHTYDQIIQARSKIKAHTQIARLADMDITPDMMDTLLAGHEDEEIANAETPEQRAKQILVERYYMSMVGHSCTRVNWTDYNRLGAKDFLVNGHYIKDQERLPRSVKMITGSSVGTTVSKSNTMAGFVKPKSQKDTDEIGKASQKFPAGYLERVV